MAEEKQHWTNDRVLWAMLFIALIVRVLPMILWPLFDCIRDECIYRSIAQQIVNGKGLTTSNKGWLPAPGYPYFLALSKYLTGYFYAVKWVQIGLSLISLGWIFAIADRVFDRKTARITAVLFALNPTLAWFTNTQWIETIYIFFLLGAILATLRALNENWRWSFAAGASLGGAVLFRGVATYLPPFFILAMAYPKDPFSPAAWLDQLKKNRLLIVSFWVALILMVAPYSAYQTSRQDGFLITDATLGHVVYLGNNDFPPLTFDYGNGMLTQPLFHGYLASGREMCKRHPVKAVKSSKCEVKRTKEWVLANKTEFVRRIPIRLAQYLNPNSFLTRHIRWGYFQGLPWIMKEGLVVLVLAFSLAGTFLGTIGAWGRARGPYAMMAVGACIYTLATITLMYGMTRFRLPVEALWTIYLAAFLANPKATIDGLRAQSWRAAGAVLSLIPLAYLTWWFLPTGFPSWW